MIPRIAADVVLVVHLGFVVFVVLGGFLLLRDLRYAWAHLPAAIWAAYVELTAGICPLTPLENALRVRAGLSGYRGGFIEHYLMPILYPPGLDAFGQRAIGAFVILLNVAVYAFALWQWRERHSRNA
ncbi:MAG TPA: DUF2784 domain-containing protein [Casimicrobiaceae bacterium]|nr:DUF2784 domain-containing protein [Casimicrobiaceae bacterium]